MLIDTSSCSNISVNSKNRSTMSKMSPSTSVPFSPQGKAAHEADFQRLEDYWKTGCEPQQSRNAQKTIEDIEKAQEDMEKRFQQCIENMLVEIERNNDSNNRLAMEVNKLKTEVSESKKDILIIEEFLQSQPRKDLKKKNIPEPTGMSRGSSSRDLFGSVSTTRNILGRRATSKFIKSKLLFKS